MDEIARVERLPCGGAYEGLTELRTLMRTDRVSRDEVDGGLHFKRVMAVAVLKPASTARNPSVLAQILSK